MLVSRLPTACRTPTRPQLRRPPLLRSTSNPTCAFSNGAILNRNFGRNNGQTRFQRPQQGVEKEVAEKHDRAMGGKLARLRMLERGQQHPRQFERKKQRLHADMEFLAARMKAFHVFMAFQSHKDTSFRVVCQNLQSGGKPGQVPGDPGTTRRLHQATVELWSAKMRSVKLTLFAPWADVTVLDRLGKIISLAGFCAIFVPVLPLLRTLLRLQEKLTPSKT